MKYIILLMSILFVFGCMESKEDSTNGTVVNDQGETYSLSPFTIDLEGIDNLIVTDVVQPDQSILFAAYEGGNIFTNKDGQIFEVEIPPGHAVKKVHDIKGGNNIAITFYVDVTDDSKKVTATCILNDVGLCELGEYEPRKMSGLGNSPFFHENNGKRRYLTDNSMVTIDIVSGEKITTPFAANGQISINNNGHMMIDTGTEISLSASFDMVLPDTMTVSNGEFAAELFPNTKKFFIPHKSGFLVKGGTRGDFYRVSDSSGDLDVRFAQHNGYWQYTNVGGTFNRITYSKDLSYCTANIVAGDDIMICHDKVYNLGDTTNDIKEYEFNWFEHAGIYDRSSIIILADLNYIYFFSDSDINDGRLTRVDFKNMEYWHVFASPGATYKISNASISNNTYRACTDNSILEINTIDATPDIIETMGDCDQLISF